MKKGIRVETANGKAENIYIGKVFDDGSFGEYIRLYTDKNNIFQIQFLKGSNLAYTFLPQCTELIDILKDGITGVSLDLMAEALLESGYIRQSA